MKAKNQRLTLVLFALAAAAIAVLLAIWGLETAFGGKLRFGATISFIVAVSPFTSRTVTANRYAPAPLNVAKVFLAAFVPLMLKVTGAGVAPISDHV